MNFGELKTEVFRRLEENSVSPVYFSPDDVGDAINEGFEELSDATEWYETNNPVNLAVDTIYYSLSSLNILTPKQAYNNQNNRWMVWTTVDRLDGRYRRWEAAGGEPDWIFTRGVWHLGTFPVPQAAGGTLTLYHTAMPTLLSADGDTPGFPQEFHYALVDYALYDLLCQEAEVAKALKFWERYQAKETALKRFVAARAKDRRIVFTGGQDAYRSNY